jgi:hypothetical protein
MTTYLIKVEMPVPGPNGEPPDRREIVAENEATGLAVELLDADADVLRAWLAGAWARGRRLA